MEPKGKSEEGLGRELEGLLAKVPPPKAPAWFAAKTLARLRQESEDQKTVSAWMRWRWAWAAGAAALVAGWVLLGDPAKSRLEISDAEVFAGLEALWQQEEENRWWAGL